MSVEALSAALRAPRAPQSINVAKSCYYEAQIELKIYSNLTNTIIFLMFPHIEENVTST